MKNFLRHDKKWSVTHKSESNRIVNALLLNFGTAQEAATTAANSFNSANREQQIFNQSLEARINRLNTAWTSFAATVGDGFLYDGIVAVTAGLEGASNNAEGVVSNFGVLAPLFGTIGIAIFALSSQFRAFTASIVASSVASVRSVTSLNAHGAALYFLGGAARVARVALSGLGIGLVFAGVGFAIERVTSAISENRQAAEQLEATNNQNIQALTTNREAVLNLVDSFRALSEERQNNPLSPEREREYLDIQNQLGEVFPALISHIDSTGQAYLRQGSALDEAIAKTNELISVQSQVDIGDSLGNIGNLLSSSSGGSFDSFNNFFSGNLLEQIDATRRNIEILNELDLDTSGQELALLNLQQQYANAYDEIRGEVLNISMSVASLNDVIIDPALATSIQGFLQNLNFEGLSQTQIESFALELGNNIADLQNAFEEADNVSFNNAVNSINELANTTNNFNPELNSFINTIDSLTQTANLTTIPVDTLGAGIEELGEDVVGAESYLNGLTNATEEYADASEQAAQLSQSQIDSVNDLLFLYDQLTLQLGNLTDTEIQDLLTKTSLTQEEQRLVDILYQRDNITNQLSSAYPHLLSQDEAAIGLSIEKRAAIQAENDANNILLDGYRLAREGKLNAEQQATLASATGTKQRIAFIKNEILALQLLQRQQNAVAEGNSRTNDAVRLNPNDNSNVRVTTTQARSNAVRISNYQVELSQLESLLASSNANIGGFVSSIRASENARKTSTPKTKQTKEDRYETDKYAQAIERVNLAIERQEDLRSTLNDYDSAYIKSLNTQIGLERERLTLQQNQLRSLQSQISRRNISGTNGGTDQQAIDRAIDQVSQLQSEILKSQANIRQLNEDIVTSTLSGFENRREILERSYNLDESRLQNVNRYTSQYNQILSTQLTNLRNKQKLNNEELAYLQRQISANKLSSSTLADLRENYNQVQIAVQDLNNQIARLELDRLGIFQVEQNRNSRLIEYYDAILETLTEGTDEYTYALNRSREATRALIVEQQRELSELLRLATRAEFSGEVFEEITDRTQELTLSINRLNYELVNADVTASRNALEAIYDAYVKTYKDATEQRRDDTLRAIDAERKAEQDAYNARVKRLNDELNLFRRNANERLELLNREESQRSFDEEINDLLSQRDQLQNRADRLLLDTSREGISRRADLLNQLDEIDKDIAERRRTRDLDLQRQSIQDSIDIKEEETEAIISEEERQFDEFTSNIDARREYYSQYYNDLLNDERRFAEIREQIFKGNLDNISNEFTVFIGELQNTLPELENTLDGTFEAVGTSIRLNVIDSLREAIDLINQYNNSSYRGASVNNGNSSGGSSSNGGSNSNNPLQTTLSQGDYQVLLGKYLNEQLVYTTDNKTTQGFIRSKGNAIAAQGRASGSNIRADQSLASILQTLNREDLQGLARFFAENASSIVDTPAFQQNIRNFGTRIASLNTGGYINSNGLGIDGIGGKLGVLHPNEVVLNRVDTQAITQTGDIFRRFLNNYSAINSGEPSEIIYNIYLTGEINASNIQDVQALPSRIIQGIKNRGGTIR